MTDAVAHSASARPAVDRSTVPPELLVSIVFATATGVAVNANPHYFVAVVVPLALVVACDRTPVIEAPRPETAPDTLTAPQLPPSSFDVPVVVDLSPVISDLEAAVPRTFGDIDDRLPLESNSRIHVAPVSRTSLVQPACRAGAQRILWHGRRSR